MSAFVVFVVVGLAGLAARGFGATTVSIALGVFVTGIALELSYRVRRSPQRIMDHRRKLDTVVRVQLLAIVIAGVVATVGFGAFESAPLEHAIPVVQAMIVGIVIASTAIYVSSLVDWYWVLPKVSGMVGLAPCERTGGERFAGVTKLWFFHRAAATTVVTFVLAGVPGYLASTSDGGTVSTGWVVLGSALAIGYNSVNSGLTAAFRYSFNPRFFVGDVIRVRANPEDAELCDAYVVDVSIQGAKFKVLPGAAPSKAKFVDKGSLLPIAEIDRTNRTRDPHRACDHAEACRAMNWYCFRNPNAHAGGDSDEARPVPYASQGGSRDD
jgi:hypothetical protein